DNLVANRTVNQGLDDTEKDVERRRRHADIGQPSCSWIAGGTQGHCDSQKGHAERDAQEDGPAKNRKAGRGCGWCADGGMKRVEKEGIPQSRRGRGQGGAVKAPLMPRGRISLLNKSYHHPPMKCALSDAAPAH